MDKAKLLTWLVARTYPMVIGVVDSNRILHTSINSVEHALSFSEIAPSTMALIPGGHKDNWLAYIDSLEPTVLEETTQVSLEDALESTPPVEGNKKRKRS